MKLIMYEQDSCLTQNSIMSSLDVRTCDMVNNKEKAENWTEFVYALLIAWCLTSLVVIIKSQNKY